MSGRDRALWFDTNKAAFVRNSIADFFDFDK